jgi:hypothetical protein
MSTSKNRVRSVNLKIDEITIVALLSRGTPSVTKNIAPLNPKINLEKYKHPCQVDDLNPLGTGYTKRNPTS